MGDKKIRMSVILVLLLVLTFATDVSAAFSFSATDATDYFDARTVNSPSMAYSDFDYSDDTGFVEVAGDHNIPWGLEYCYMEVVLRFQASEDCTSFKVASAWTLTYKLETNWPVGYANVKVRYVLYTDGYSALETHDTNINDAAITPLWGSYDSCSGISSKTTSYYITFAYDLQENTYYRVGIQLYLALNGEANAWSYSGASNPVNLDVSEILVYN